MPREVLVPDVGEGLAEVHLLEWHVTVGDEVLEDQPLADVETDKAIVALPCPCSGTVTELRAGEGETIAVGAVLAVIAEPAVAGAAGAPASDAGPAHEAPPAAASEPAPAAPPSRERAASGALATPATRRLARELGVELASLAGSGPGGRIVREDVERAAAAPAPGGSPAPAPASAPSPTPGRDDTLQPLRGVRRAIARTLTEAWQTIPHVIDYREADVGALLELRRRLKAQAAARGDERLAKALTVTPLLAKIAAVCLRAHPLVNASIDMEREQVVLHGRVNLGLATATPDGLMVPVVPDADTKTVAELALEGADLLDAARERRLAPEQLAGGTFTVNNYGALGIWLGTPIIKPPQVANLGFGRVREQPVAIDGEVVVRPIVALACSGDHRLLDGDTLAAFVSDVVARIEDPGLLLLDAR